jgi:superfamily I DNA/RNA helicase
MLMVNALAGTGKTTTICWGIGERVPTGVTPSKEQLQIVKFMRSFKWNSCAAMAFNKSIAEVLKKRLEHVPGVTCATSNGFGHRNWTAFCKGKRLDVNASKLFLLLKEKLKEDRVDYKDSSKWSNDVIKVVQTIKQQIATINDYETIAEDADIILGVEHRKYIEWLYEKSINTHDFIDFDDQLYMPYHFQVPIAKFDLVVVDEAQDLNKAKQWLAFNMTEKYLVTIGDPNQAIYGFSGADCESMNTMSKYMTETWKEDFQTMSLTVTRRCPKTVVSVANKYVPTLRAADEAPEGKVINTKEEEFKEQLLTRQHRCMVLSRTNAPLMSLAFYLLRNNRPCFIQGKDIGTGIVKLLNSCKGNTLEEKLGDLSNVVAKKCTKYEEKGQMDKAELLKDKELCIRTICDNVTTVEEFKSKVESLFRDSGTNTEHQLSSVHKSKGLECHWVSIYKPSLLPLKLTSRAGKRVPKGAQQQEFNLAYVAYTRSQDTLEFVMEPKKT